VVRQLNKYRKGPDGELVLKPTATIVADKTEIKAGDEEIVIVKVECPEYQNIPIILDIGDRTIEVSPSEEIELSSTYPGMLKIEVKSKHVLSEPCYVKVVE